MKKFVLTTAVATGFFIAAFTLASFTNTTGKADEKLNATSVQTANTTYTEYQLIQDTRSAYYVGLMVKEEMKTGWQPIGGITRTEHWYIQVMVK